MSMHKKDKDNSILIFLGVTVLVAVGFILIAFNNSSADNSQNDVKGENVTVSDNTQIIEITAKSGYSPSTVTAKAGFDTVLRIKTSNTFDCSSSFVIPKLNISKILPSTGTTDISLGKQVSGSQILGVCGMGMYKVTLNFS